MVKSFNLCVTRVPKRREGMKKSNVWKDDNWEFSQTDKRSQPTNFGRSVKPKLEKYKENCT